MPDRHLHRQRGAAALFVTSARLLHGLPSRSRIATCRRRTASATTCAQHRFRCADAARVGAGSHNDPAPSGPTPSRAPDPTLPAFRSRIRASIRPAAPCADDVGRCRHGDGAGAASSATPPAVVHCPGAGARRCRGDGGELAPRSSSRWRRQRVPGRPHRRTVHEYGEPAARERRRPGAKRRRARSVMGAVAGAALGPAAALRSAAILDVGRARLGFPRGPRRGAPALPAGGRVVASAALVAPPGAARRFAPPATRPCVLAERPTVRAHFGMDRAAWRPQPRRAARLRRRLRRPLAAAVVAARVSRPAGDLSSPGRSRRLALRSYRPRPPTRAPGGDVTAGVRLRYCARSGTARRPAGIGAGASSSRTMQATPPPTSFATPPSRRPRA